MKNFSKWDAKRAKNVQKKMIITDFTHEDLLKALQGDSNDQQRPSPAPTVRMTSDFDSQSTAIKETGPFKEKKKKTKRLWFINRKKASSIEEKLEEICFSCKVNVKW